MKSIHAGLASFTPTANLTLGMNADYHNTVINDMACYNYSLSKNDIKESVDGLTLLLNATNKNKSYLGQSTALFIVLPNVG